MPSNAYYAARAFVWSRPAGKSSARADQAIGMRGSETVRYNSAKTGEDKSKIAISANLCKNTIYSFKT